VDQQHTSVPRWPAEVPVPDPAARALALVAFGAAGERLLLGWRAAVAGRVPLWQHVADRADELVLDLLAAQVAGARVGWRLMLAGPEVDVLSARSLVSGLGVLDAEIRAAVTGADAKRVFCPHCRTTTTGATPVSGELTCAGCSRRLHVYAHVSRRIGAYLGFMVDAEESA
jgi:hypothetical protein